MTYALFRFVLGSRVEGWPICQVNSVQPITYATFIFIALFGTSPKGWGTPQVGVTYGSSIIDETGVFFTDSSQTGFDEKNAGVIAVGYFNSGFDVQTEAQRLVSDNLPDFLTNFNVLASSSFRLAPSPGYFASFGTFSEQSVGSTPYLLTLAGISSFDDAVIATEVGLFSDSSFPVLPEGGGPIPTEYNLAITLSFDTVLHGAEISKSTFGDGNAYATAPIPDLHPIWDGATDIGNNWLYLSWFGLFFQEATSDWAYHYQLGWVYPSGTDPDGFWIWHPGWNSWAYTGTNIFPLLWLDTEQKWIWMELQDTGTFTTQYPVGIYDFSTNHWEIYNSMD